MHVYGLIPSRLESSRLPEKALLDIHGYPMIVHVAKRSALSKKLTSVVVCTDSEKIAAVCHQHNIKTYMTGNHINGTDRIAEAYSRLDTTLSDIVIDIQGDEPLVDPGHIDAVVDKTITSNMDIVIPYQEIDEKSDNISKPKMVISENRVLYLSRAKVPYPFRTNTPTLLKTQLCIIGFKPTALLTYAAYKNKPSYLEAIEGIELIRALEAGLNIETFKLSGESLSVDTLDDYYKILKIARRVEYD